ncbi:hypothetical protein BDQ17DRAFT_1233008 [Cyathus striatus]|nr:hypothetical protein BDQ17DRAFT_1233008 [Cyathus striatus]
MSFFVGPVSGALLAGGVYYGFSNLINTRTEQHRKDLRALSVRLSETPTLTLAPPSAAARISDREFSTYVKSRWNEEVAYMVAGFRGWGGKAQDWGRKVLYGELDPNRHRSQLRCTHWMQNDRLYTLWCRQTFHILLLLSLAIPGIYQTDLLTT